MGGGEWLIVYADGSTYSSDDGPPEDAPTSGVQVVYNANASVGFKVEQSRPGYWGWVNGYGWMGYQTDSGYWDYLMPPGVMKYVLYGRILPDEDWHEIQKKAGELATGLAKSGWWKSESDYLKAGP